MATSKELAEKTNADIEIGKYYDALIIGVKKNISKNTGNESLVISLKLENGEVFDDFIPIGKKTYFRVDAYYKALEMDDAEVGTGWEPEIHNENIKGFFIGVNFKSSSYKDKIYININEILCIPKNREDEVVAKFEEELPF